MAFEVIWSPNSIKCIHAIGLDLVRRDSVINANKVIGAIRFRIEKLRMFPESGHSVSEFKNSKIREVIVKKKRVIYEIAVDRIHILAIVPERMALVNIECDWIWPGV